MAEGNEPHLLGGDAELPLRHWIEAQRLALGASLLRAVQTPSDAHLQTVFSPLAAFMPSAGPESQAEYLAFLSTLPLMTLEALCRLDSSKLGEWQSHYPLWQRARAEMIWDENRELSPIAGAKLLANRILTGAFTAAQLVRIASLELGRDWSKVTSIYPALDRLVGELRAQPNDTHSRPAKLSAFREQMVAESGGEPERWALVENCLLHQSYCWPLVVLRLGDPLSTEPSSFSTPAFALPIEAHVALGGTGKITVYPEKAKYLNHEDWKRSAEQSLAAAKNLWLHEHSSWDTKYHQLVQDAAFVLDLRVAEAIVEPYKSKWIALELKDSSLEAYLSLVILSHFLGDKEAMETVCATGSLLNVRPDKIGGDYFVDRPDHVEAKLEWARSTGLYDQFITVRSDPKYATPLSRKGSLRVSEVGKFNERETRREYRVKAMLSEFATKALSDSQRHRYVRCPDVAYAFRNMRESPEVDHLFNIIRSNTKPILQLDRSIKGTTIAQALYRVNEAVRKEADAGTKLGRFAFVRAIENEMNERFWQIIWHLLRGSSEAFDQFRFAVDTTTAAELLAKQLNRFVPDGGRLQQDQRLLRRAPDVIVIIGSNRLSRPKSVTPNSPFARLLLDPIMEGLSKLLVPSPVNDMFQPTGQHPNNACS